MPCPAEQEAHLRPAVPHQRRNPARSGSPSPTPRRRDPFLQPAAPLGSEAPTSSHVHCVVPAGGLSLDYTHWIRSRARFFLSIKVLSRVFRGKFVAALKRAGSEGKLRFYGDLNQLAQPKIFSAWLRRLFRHDWVVYCKPPFGGPEHALRYLGAYTHRVAISNHRLVSLADGQVTFRWRDSAHKNKKRLMTLPVEEFLLGFLLHPLPRGFVRIRNFGFLANRRRALSLPLCTHLLGSAHQSNPVPALAPRPVRALTLWFCPSCGGPMQGIERLTAAQILRAPPLPREHAT